MTTDTVPLPRCIEFPELFTDRDYRTTGRPMPHSCLTCGVVWVSTTPVRTCRFDVDAYRARVTELAEISLKTATDVIDLLATHVSDMVMTMLVGTGTDPDAATFSAAFARTFTAALPVFLARIDRLRPELGARLRRCFITEQEARCLDRLGDRPTAKLLEK